MYNKISFLFALMLLVLGTPVSAKQIQIIPPVESGTAEGTPCVSNHGSKILTWDGDNPLKCNNKAVIDASGNLGVGTETPTEKIDVDGNASFRRNVKVGGTLDIGAVLVSHTCNPYERDIMWGANGECRVLCPNGRVVVSGGCYNSDWLNPSTFTWGGPHMWRCSSTSVAARIEATALCAYIKVDVLP